MAIKNNFFINSADNILTRWDAPLPRPDGSPFTTPSTKITDHPGGMFFVEEPRGYNGFESWTGFYRNMTSGGTGQFSIQKSIPNNVKSLNIFKNSPEDIRGDLWGQLGIGEPNAGKLGLRKLVGDKKFFKLAGKSREDLLKLTQRAYPNLNLELYKTENLIGRQSGQGPLLSLLGAEKARRKGYQAIRYEGKNEYLALTEDSVKDLEHFIPHIQPEPIAAAINSEKSFAIKSLANKKFLVGGGAAGLGALAFITHKVMKSSESKNPKGWADNRISGHRKMSKSL